MCAACNLSTSVTACVSAHAGIKEKLDHFLDLNIKAVWISPFYRSPMKDFGYDVEDFRDVDPLFGNMQDFEELLVEMHNKGVFLLFFFFFFRDVEVGFPGLVSD